MIGNLGNVVCHPMLLKAENVGNSGNATSELAQILHQHDKRLFPWDKFAPGTLGTLGEKPVPVPNVPRQQMRIGNTWDDKIDSEKQQFIKPVPGVPTKNIKIDTIAIHPTSSSPLIILITWVVTNKQIIGEGISP